MDVEGLFRKSRNNSLTNIISVPSFSIEQFLHSITIKKERIPSYAKFLTELEVEESSIPLLTEERLFKFAALYKQQHSDFELKLLDAAAIAEAAKNYGKKGS